MSFVIAAGPSLLAKIRGLLGLRARALFLGVFLGVGALSGMPIRPEEIEKHMRCMSKAEVVQLLENERQPSGDPSESESAVHSTVSTS